MIIENKVFLDGQIAHPGYFLVVYYKYECIHIGKRLKCVTWIHMVLNYIEFKQNRRHKMKELISIKDSDYKLYRELKLQYLNTRIPSKAYDATKFKLTSNQKGRIYQHWTRYENIINASSDADRFIVREKEFKNMPIVDLNNRLFTKAAISLRRILTNPFVLMLRPKIKAEYETWVNGIVREYGLQPENIKHIPIRGRRKGLFKLYIHPDYSKFSRAYNVEKSIEVLYRTAVAMDEGKITDAVSMREVVCNICRRMGYVPSFQTGTIVKLYNSMKLYYKFYLDYKGIADDLYKGKPFSVMNKKYNFTNYGIYNIKELYAKITINMSIIALYVRTKDTIISRLFNINYKGYMN